MDLDIRTFIPVQVEPAQTIDYVFCECFVRTNFVRVFQAQNISATMPAGKQVVVERGAGRAHMQIACGAGDMRTRIEDATRYLITKRRFFALKGNHAILTDPLWRKGIT